jgi:tetrahydromethanopterin S-methyltransferase subunit F
MRVVKASLATLSRDKRLAELYSGLIVGETAGFAVNPGPGNWTKH